MFGSHATAIKSDKRAFVFRYASAQHWLEVFRGYYGPLLKAFAALDRDAATALEHDVIELVGQFNRSGDKAMVVPSDYLEIVITCR